MSYPVLVWVDESAIENGLIRQIAQLFPKNDELVFVGLHVVDVVPAGSPGARGLGAWLGTQPTAVPEAVASWYLERGDALLTEFSKIMEHHGFKHTTLLETGSVGERLRHHSQRFELTILERKKPSGELLPGEQADVGDETQGGMGPTLLLQMGVSLPERLVLACANIDHSHRALRHVARLTPLLGLPILAVYVSEDEPRNDDPLEEALRHLFLCGIQAQGQRMVGETAEALTAIISEQPSLLVLGDSHKSRIGRLIWGTLADWVLQHSAVWVLVTS
jgi:hypothetical protein